MNKIIKILLIIILVLIILILSIITYIMIKNPFGVGGVIKASIFKSTVEENVEKYKNYDHPLLTSDQEQALIEAGVDIEQIPTQITTEQQQCGIDKLGQDRINEIMSGETPSALEVVKLLQCAN